MDIQKKDNLTDIVQKLPTAASTDNSEPVPPGMIRGSDGEFLKLGIDLPEQVLPSHTKESPNPKKRSAFMRMFGLE